MVMASILLLSSIEAVMASDCQVTGNVSVKGCPIATGAVGIDTDVDTLDFGELYPLQTSSAIPVTLSITASGYDELLCQGAAGIEPTEISVTVTAGDWIATGENAMAQIEDAPTDISGDISAFGIPIDLPVNDDSSLSFTVTPPLNALPDTYTQTITITATY